MGITVDRWLQVLTTWGVQAATVVWAPLFERCIQDEAFSQGRRELDDLLGQILHETGRLERLVEDLNYNPQRLCEVWPERFHGVTSAVPYAWNHEALAEKVYGGRADLGNDMPGDGAKYPGRGIPMITGKANYRLLQQLTALPLVDFPVLLENKSVALRCAVPWWEKRVPDSAIDTIERAVQGAQLGLADRRRRTELAEWALA